MAERDLETAIQRVKGWIDAAGRVVVLTGAGISTDSGIPDFRGPQGVWTKNPEAEKQATIQHYVADKDVRRRAWKSRLETFGQQREPNAGHLALVGLERRGFSRERIARIHHAYRVLLRSKLNTSQAIEKLRAEGDLGDDVELLLKFVESSERGVIK